MNKNTHNTNNLSGQSLIKISGETAYTISDLSLLIAWLSEEHSYMDFFLVDTCEDCLPLHERKLELISHLRTDIIDTITRRHLATNYKYADT